MNVLNSAVLNTINVIKNTAVIRALGLGTWLELEMLAIIVMLKQSAV